MDGGIFGLLGLIAAHRGAVEYDLRARFGLGLRDVGDRITLSEVARLVTILRNDPSSAIAAAVEGWDYPISREALLLADLFDLTVSANTDTKKGRPKPHPGRPFAVDDRTKTRRGNAGTRTPTEVKAILAQYGHGAPV